MVLDALGDLWSERGVERERENSVVQREKVGFSPTNYWSMTLQELLAVENDQGQLW